MEISSLRRRNHQDWLDISFREDSRHECASRDCRRYKHLTTTDYHQPSLFENPLSEYNETTDYGHHEDVKTARLQSHSEHSHLIAESDDKSSSSTYHSVICKEYSKDNHEVKTLMECNHLLTKSLANNLLSITPALLEKRLISTEVEEEVHCTSISSKKAAAVVSAIRNSVTVNPKLFHDFLSVLREHTWAASIARILQSVYRSKFNNV